VRFQHDGKFHNLHLLAVSLFDRKTASKIFDTGAKVLDILAPNWRMQLVGISTDGERTMTGRITGVSTQFGEEADGDVVRVWCALHQLDLVVQAEFKKLHDDEFVTILTGLVSYLRRQFNLITRMKSTCPKFMDTRWCAMKKLTVFLQQGRAVICEYLEQKQPPCTPPATWWIVTITLDAVAGKISIVVKRLQGLRTVLSQQKAQLQRLAEKLKSLCEVRGPHDDSTLSMIDRNSNVICGPYAVSLSNARDFIENQGSFVMGAMAALPMEDDFMMVRSVASLLCGLVNGISNVVAHRDRNNDASDEIIPATLPQSLPAAHICPVRVSTLPQDAIGGCLMGRSSHRRDRERPQSHGTRLSQRNCFFGCNQQVL
jgi:hypothetical protein